MTMKVGSSTTLRMASAVCNRYGVAALAVISAFALNIAMPPGLMAPGTAQLVFALAVLVAAWHGGLGPGLFAAALILLAAWPGDPSAPQLLRVVVFFTLCLMSSILMGSLRRSRELAVSETTARKRLEDELRLQAEELREASRRKDEFIAMLAHELRNPLAAISGAFAISARSAVAEDLEWSRSAIDRNIKQLARLIDDLLDVSRVTRGKIELRKERFDVASVIDQAVDSIQYLLAPKGHQLGVSVARGSLWVDADAARLQQILANLLTNSIQYSDPASYISLRAHQRNGEIVISVRDKGQGIRSDLLPHVFELFRQGDRSLARTEGGLGIGLTMVKALAEMHGGTVTAASDGPGKGSEFVVCLPSAERRDKAAASQPSSTAPAQRRGNRILVVDDNVDLTRALTTLLSRFGYEVQAVYDGQSAIEAARAQRPEVVLLDIGLPGMDGYEVARRLRLEEGFHDATIIAITGYGQEDGYNQSRAEGFNHHLIKPVQIEALVALLAEPGRKRVDSNH